MSCHNRVVTNLGNGFQSESRVMVTHSKPMVPCTSKIAKKKEASTCTRDSGLCRNILPKPLSLESCGGVSCMDTIQMRDDHPTTKVSGLPSPSSLHTPRSMNISPCRSLCASVSVDETMSICDSLKIPEFEYVENEEVSAVKSIERKATTNLYISEYTQKEGSFLLIELNLLNIVISV